MDKQDIINDLRNLVTNKQAEMSVNVYEYVWHLIQTIELEVSSSDNICDICKSKLKITKIKKVVK